MESTSNMLNDSGYVSLPDNTVNTCKYHNEAIAMWKPFASQLFRTDYLQDPSPTICK